MKRIKIGRLGEFDIAPGLYTYQLRSSGSGPGGRRPGASGAAAANQAPIAEVALACPVPGYVWVRGSWGWCDNHWVWTRGHWGPPAQWDRDGRLDRDAHWDHYAHWGHGYRAERHEGFQGEHGRR